MLKHRFITAAILILLFVFSIFYLPTSAIGLLISVFLLLALREWVGFAGFQRFPSFILLAGVCLEFFLIAFILFPFLLILIFEGLETLQILANPFSYPCSWPHLCNMLSLNFAAIVVTTWTGALIAVLTYPKHTHFYTQGRFGLTTGLFVLLPPFLSFLLLHHKSPMWVMYPLILVWVADIAAFFVGRSFGKHKLAPSISPGKTWEGVAGAFVGGIAVTIAGYYYLDIHFQFWIWMLLNLLLITFSIIGDLFESIFKRVHGLKDSGRLLPGHGGILDRIDSLTAALPIFTAALILVGQLKL